MVTVLDGPIGSLLAARGVPTPPPAWSASALITAPEEVARIHADYAAAGATVHTANTFRTKRRQSGPTWRDLTRLALSIVRASVPTGHLVAGSLSPLEDCYRPDLSPSNPRPEHREMARALAEEGADLILCETFPHVGEALIAVEEAVSTGLPVWVAFTAGPEGALLTPREMAIGAREAVKRGVSAVLVNCTPAARTLPFVERLADSGVPFGAYANAGDVGDVPEDFNRSVGDKAAETRYLDFARTWIAAGATLVGSCCGTGPGHIAALRHHLTPATPTPALGPVSK